jgi:hypothetical protein
MNNSRINNNTSCGGRDSADVIVVGGGRDSADVIVVGGGLNSADVIVVGGGLNSVEVIVVGGGRNPRWWARADASGVRGNRCGVPGIDGLSA